MNVRFERSGPLNELRSYPQWAQDMIGRCEEAKQQVVQHEMWTKMRECRVDPEERDRFMIGLWPVIEGFPGFMARSLLKTRYGRSEGDNMARRWLVRNIRVEQNHAEYWIQWAEGAGVPREKLLNAPMPPGTQDLARWCEEASAKGSLAAGLAAVNYAVEGATGEWAQKVYDSQDYRDSFPAETRKANLRWLKLHAAYDDEHPWEALEIVCTLVGAAPPTREILHLGECIRRTYTCMRLFGDRCLERSHGLEATYGTVAAA